MPREGSPTPCHPLTPTTTPSTLHTPQLHLAACRQSPRRFAAAWWQAPQSPFGALLHSPPNSRPTLHPPFALRLCHVLSTLHYNHLSLSHTIMMVIPPPCNTCHSRSAPPCIHPSRLSACRNCAPLRGARFLHAHSRPAPKPTHHPFHPTYPLVTFGSLFASGVTLRSRMEKGKEYPLRGIHCPFPYGCPTAFSFCVFASVVALHLRRLRRTFSVFVFRGLRVIPPYMPSPR